MDIKELQYGANGEVKWMCGHVLISGEPVYIDTRTGLGVDTIMEKMEGVVQYLASTKYFGSMPKEDMAQELRIIILESIPKFVADKNANIITFLNNNLKNRVINKYKHYSSKSQNAISYGTKKCRLRCPECNVIAVSDHLGMATCHKCLEKSNNGKIWKKYNIAVSPLPFSALLGKDEDKSSFAESIEDGLDVGQFFGSERMPIDQRIGRKIDFIRNFEKLSDKNKNIIKMLMNGHSYKDISNKNKVSATCVRNDAHKCHKLFERGMQ